MLRTWKFHRAFMVTCLLAFTVVACNDDDDDPAGPGGDPLVGTWNATSLTATGVPNPIGLGMSMTLTLASGGTFTIVFTNDLVGFCDGPANCTQTGTYTSTATTITIDPSDSDPGTFNYTISGSVLTLTGDIDGTDVTFVFQKA